MSLKVWHLQALITPLVMAPLAMELGKRQAAAAEVSQCPYERKAGCQGGHRDQPVAAFKTILSTLGEQGYRFEALCQ